MRLVTCPRERATLDELSTITTSFIWNGGFRTTNMVRIFVMGNMGSTFTVILIVIICAPAIGDIIINTIINLSITLVVVD